MSDPTDYQRKVAERLCRFAGEDSDSSEAKRVATVLASEGVVDPEVVYMLDKVRAERDKAEAEVERLEAEKYDSSNTTMVETIRQAVAAERERAAKIAEGSLSWCMTAGETEASAIAAAIRAKIASATVSHADGADSTDTLPSDG